MTTATIDREKQERRERQANFQAPNAPPGIGVLFYPDGKRTGGTPLVGVLSVNKGNRMFVIQVGQNLMMNVRHISDPKLEEPIIRKSGAWDFTPEYLAQQEAVEDLRNRVTALEAALTTPKKGS